MMGRYSLDKPGLIYAHSGNQGFDPSQYRTFAADDDGILPLTEFGWFDDDVAHRFENFLATAWHPEHLDENLQYVADSLGPKKGESPRETIRRYLAADFFKHHLSMYKRRPIYWLFSSGKQRGFQALVYLHRYNEGTLARMRTEYVIPLLGKMTARINHLTDDIAAATSSQHRKRLETEKAAVTKQLAEVQAFDERLRHCADQRIKLDLDDGVKVNYGKFGDLLADVKAVCGTKDED
jgi:type II restriction/modification system DNA methylase subunit YeeA